MYNDDYVILIDENGQPYIEHSVFSKARDAVKSAGRSAHKYIAKVGEGAKARYFYTQEELKAFYNRGKKALSDASGLTARRQAQATARVAGASSNSPGTRKAAGRAYVAAVAKYARTPLGRIETFMQDPVGNTKRGAERVGAAARSGAERVGAAARSGAEAVRSGASKAASAVRSGASKAAGAVRGAAERVGDWAGVDERRALNDAFDKYSGSNWFTRDINEHQLNRSWNDYLKTPLGRLEATLGTIRRNDDDIVSIPERVGNAARSAAEAVRSGAASAHEAAQKAAKSAWDAAKRTAGRAGEAISSGASKVAGAAKNAGDAAKKAPTLAKARADYQRAVREYEKALERGGDGYAEYYAMLEAAGLVQQLGGTFK